MYRRIIVPLDGSELAAQALVHARELARRLGAPVHLVRVVDAHVLARIGATGLTFDADAVRELVKEEDEDATAYLDRQLADLRGDGMEVSGAVVHGPVAGSIVAASKGDDLIVMASHGRSGLRRWFLGSVAEEVLRQATAPVLLIRMAHEEGSEPPATRR